MASLRRVTPDIEAVRAARERIAVPMMYRELNAANTANQTINRLAPRIAQKEASRGDALNSAGRLYGWGAQQSRIIKNKLDKTPGWVKPETVGRFSENIDSAMKGHKLAYDVSKQRAAEAEFMRRQIGSRSAGSDHRIEGADQFLDPINLQPGAAIVADHGRRDDAQQRC